MAERAQAHVLGRPRSHALVFEKLGRRRLGLEPAETVKVEAPVEHAARDADDVASLGPGNLDAAQLARCGDGQRRGLRKGAVASAFVFERLAVGVHQSFLHLMRKRQVDLLLEDGGDERLVNVWALGDAHAAKVFDQPAEHRVDARPAVKGSEVEFGRELAPDQALELALGRGVAGAGQDAQPQDRLPRLTRLTNPEEDTFSSDFRDSPILAFLEVVQQGKEGPAVGERRGAEHEAQGAGKIKRLSGSEPHAEPSRLGPEVAACRDGAKSVSCFQPPHSTQGDFMAELPSTAVAKDESTLVAEAKAGSYAAFDELVNRYEKKIYRLGLNITGSPEDAEDVLQETFLKAFEHLADFRQDSRFYTWLVRIGVNQGLMKLRKRRGDKTVPMGEVEGEDGEVAARDFADWRPNPEQLLERSELETILRNAAETLPPVFRSVFFLRDVEGLSTEETAQLLNLSPGAVKARLFRARLRLRDELSEIFKGDGRVLR